MGQVTTENARRHIAPFNGPVEIGCRALCILTAAYPSAYRLERLVVFDYLVVHSDDVPGGPTGLHPQTPHRGGEIYVRRGVLQDGLLLYQSRGLVERTYAKGGIYFSATDKSAGFLDALTSEYVAGLRARAEWIVETFGPADKAELEAMVRERIGVWGAEFTMESVLWEERTS